MARFSRAGSGRASPEGALIEVRPEPSEDERAAILAALELLLAEDSGQPAASEWWQAGVRENLDENDEL